MLELQSAKFEILSYMNKIWDVYICKIMIAFLLHYTWLMKIHI
jgi:hypothetical protein